MSYKKFMLNSYISRKIKTLQSLLKLLEQATNESEVEEIEKKAYKL